MVEDNSVLYLKLSGVLVERVPDDPFQDLFPASGPRLLSLIDLLNAIGEAKDDPKIKGVYIEPQYLRSGYASLQEVRDALIEFKESGKFIYTYGEYISESDYYVASVSDSVFLNPEGSLEFNGLSANVTFWKGLFDKLEIEPEIFRVGEFKSYVEPFQQKKMSEENRLQISELLNSVYGHYIKNVSASRGIQAQDLRAISDKLKVYLPEDAVEYGLVDRLAYEDEAKSLILDEVDESDFDDINFISFRRYAKTLKSAYSKNRIAVIMASGEIVQSGPDEDVISGEKFAREIRKARESSSVKAIVLRVNSPGGSLTGSDMIWREVQLTKGVKPIIASMSNVAASGGYYISMLADTIVAQPNTITGSIGIFGMLFNLEKFLENKLGITHDVVNTGEYSDLITVTRPLNEFERQTIQKGVEKGYETFVRKAAEGRGLTIEEMKKIAGGRVWSGLQAKENGLIDVLGSFGDAIELAAGAAGLGDDYRVRLYPQQRPFIEQLMGRLSDEADARILGFRSAYLAPYIENIESLTRLQGLQARMPGMIEIN